MYRPVHAVEVRAWGKIVGAVALDPRLAYYAFEYAPEFIKKGIELAPLTMPLRQANQPFIFPSLPELTYRRLPALLADALPDDFGNSLIDAWMAREGVTAANITSLDRLAYMGKRAFGALEFRPARGPRNIQPTAIELSRLVETARRVVHGHIDDDPHAEAALRQILSVGTSAGGARAKAAIAWNPRTDEIRAGQFDVEPGFEHWLLKFDGLGRDHELGDALGYGRIEYAYSLMAQQAGIAMSACRLLEEGGRAHFMTKRFDRDVNRKIHMQTLCGMAQLDYKARGVHDYNQLLNAIRELSLDARDMEQAFRRIAFNVMGANCDDHTKNFSFLLVEPGHWTLSPAYDVTHAYNPKGAWTYQHLMSVNGKFSQITRDDLLVVADRYQIGGAQRIVTEVRQSIAAWPEFARRAGVSPKDLARVQSDHLLL